MERLPAVGKLCFGDCELDLATGELRRGDQLVALGGLPAKLLGLLAWKNRELVTRDEIQQHLWPDGTIVEFDQSINQHVRQLRHVLGDSAVHPAWIQTLPARGYRLLVAASYSAAPASRGDLASPPAVPGPGDPDPCVVEPGAPSLPAPRRSRSVARTIVALGLAVAGVLAASGSAPPPAVGAADAATVRIAVLPLVADEASAEPRALGLTEDVITALGEGYAPGLEAIALRTVLRYRDGAVPASTIARELGVAYLVEGRVRSRDGRVRVTVRLVRARDSIQLWARTFDQADAGWGVEAAIAQDVAAALGRMLLVRPAASEPPLDAVAQEAFLRGRYLQQRRRPRLAAAAFAEVTARAPRSARAWAARAAIALQTANEHGFAAAAEAADAALTIDPEQPEAHFVRATIAFYAEWNIERACQHYAAAIRANPAYAEAHHAMAACYSATGRHHEAIAAMARARALDPFAPEVLSDVGWYYFFARRFDEAAAWCARTLELEPTYYWAHRCIVMARTARGDRSGALLAALADLRARHAADASVAEVVTAADPVAAYWRWELAHPGESSDVSDRAASLLQLGDRDGALDELERAATSARGWLLPFLAVDPTFDPVRATPRFQRILAQVRAGTALR